MMKNIAPSRKINMKKEKQANIDDLLDNMESKFENVNVHSLLVSTKLTPYQKVN